MKAWTEAEIETLQRRFQHEPTQALAAEIGCTESDIKVQVRKLGLRKTAAYMAQMRARFYQNGKVARAAIEHKHGCAAREGKNPTYSCWSAMMQRCLNTQRRNYSNYGGRGITVCAEWRDFRNFLRDMGERPDGKTLDRIDNDGPYAPWNCRWLSFKDQQNNKRTNRLLTAFGRTQTLTQWAEEVGITPSGLSNRIGRGMAVETALTKPLQVGHSR